MTRLDRFEAGLRRNLLAVCLVAGLVALALRLVLIFGMMEVPSIDWDEMELISRSLAETGQFANPYKLPTGLTAHHAPIYPFLLAGIFRVFGYGAAAANAIVTTNLVFAAGIAALMPWVATCATLPATAGLMGAVFIIIPVRILKETRGEAPFVGLLFILTVGLTLLWLRRIFASQQSRQDFRGAVGLGLLWGFVSLAAAIWPLAGLVILTWVAIRALQLKSRFLFAQALTTGLFAFLTLSPWLIRNHYALGGVNYIRSNFPLEFSLSNNDSAFPTAEQNYAVGFPDNYFHRHHPWSSAQVAREVQALGEREFNKELLQQTLEWCRTHPDKFARLTLQRMSQYWIAWSSSQELKSLFVALATAGGLLTFCWNARRLGIVAVPFLALLIFYPLPLYLVQMDTRYRYPLDWSIWLFFGYGYFVILKRTQPSLHAPDNSVAKTAAVSDSGEC